MNPTRQEGTGEQRSKQQSPFMLCSLQFEKPNMKRNMKSKLLYQGLSLLAAAAALIGASDTALAQQTGQKPNFVHIVADDLGWKDVGFNGCTDIKTPNIDALAAGGATFTQFYVQPMCAPTRAALEAVAPDAI